jgi:Cep192 domain 4
LKTDIAVTVSDNFQTEQGRVHMKNLGRKSKLIGAMVIMPVFVLLMSTITCSAQGIIITLENTGSLPITSASLGFDVKPLEPGQTIDVTVGSGLAPSNIGDFQLGVMPISEDNPLAPGGTACVGPLAQLSSGDYVEYAGVGTSVLTAGFEVPPGPFELIPDVTTIPFDIAVVRVPGGVFRFLSSVPDSCKTNYVPPFGKMSINSDALLTTATSVDLSLSCYPTVGYSCQEMQFSNDNINWSAPEPYTKNKTWVLLPGDGKKTVYVRLKDNPGNWSDAYSDTIILSTPTLTQIRSFPIPTFPDPDTNINGLAFGDGKLFALNIFSSGHHTQSEKIYVLDPADGNILKSFSSTPEGSDLSSDGVNLYVNKFAPVEGDIVKLNSKNGSKLATIHPSGVSITGGEGGLALLNSDIFQVAATENCSGDSIVRLNKKDGSFSGCFNVDTFGSFAHELDSDGTNLLYGTWVHDTVDPHRYYWTVFTLSPGGSFLKSDIIFSTQSFSVPGAMFEAWGDNQLFVVDRQSNQIMVFDFPSTGTVAPTSLNFGQVLVGSTSTPQTVTISNKVSANLVISSIGITGADAGMFSAAPGGPNPCSSLTPAIAPVANCTIDVTFSPTSTLKKTAALSISSDAPDENSVNVSLSGTGISTAVITPNGGEIISSGSTYAIQWGASSDAVRFDLQYSVNDGLTWKTIARKVTGTSYDWHVPVPANSKTSCLVRVTGFNSSGRKAGKDISDSTFTIESVK